MMDKYVPVGKVIRPHGIKGALKVWPYFDNSGFYLNLKEVRIVTEEKKELDFQILKAFSQKNSFIYYLKGVDSFEASEEFKGIEILVRSINLEKLPSDDYYWHDLEGLSVYTVDGLEVGQIVDFFPTGSNQVLRVWGEKGEVLIPAIKDVISQVDLEGRKVIIIPLEGLLD